MRGLAAVLGAHLVTATVALGADANVDAGVNVDANAEASPEEAEAALDFPRALAAYDAVVAHGGASPEAARARARAAWLRARSEGGFAPLARLERARRAAEIDAPMLDALVRDADAFPPGLVRVETWAFAADAYARLEHPEEARELRRRILGDPRADDVTAAKASRDLVDDALARGALADARAVATGGHVTPDVVALVARATRRHHVHVASIAVVLACGLLAGASVLRAVRSHAGARVLRAGAKTLRTGLVMAAWIGGVGALLALGYEGGDARPFVVLGVALVPTFFVARAWSAASPRTSRPARAARALVCGCAALAVAFLVLEGTDVRYLEGLGL